jgi:hypothetical protein
MESLTILVQNKSQAEFLYSLLKHIDFVVFPESTLKRIKKADSDYSIFNLAGIWSDRTITQSELRAKAWKRI